MACCAETAFSENVFVSVPNGMLCEWAKDWACPSAAPPQKKKRKYCVERKR